MFIPSPSRAEVENPRCSQVETGLSPGDYEVICESVEESDDLYYKGPSSEQPAQNDVPSVEAPSADDGNTPTKSPRPRIQGLPEKKESDKTVDAQVPIRMGEPCVLADGSEGVSTWVDDPDSKVVNGFGTSADKNIATYGKRSL